VVEMAEEPEDVAGEHARVAGLTDHIANPIVIRNLRKVYPGLDGQPPKVRGGGGVCGCACVCVCGGGVSGGGREGGQGEGTGGTARDDSRRQKGAAVAAGVGVLVTG
jgi:hypothetical protein